MTGVQTCALPILDGRQTVRLNLEVRYEFGQSLPALHVLAYGWERYNVLSRS